jgi:ubiquinone biosynthesis protein UbiJ
MLDALANLLAPPVLERLTLVLNHVLRAEPVAQARLLGHAGARVTLQLSGWPSLLPPPPLLAWSITPAGLLEWRGLPGAGTAGSTEAGTPPTSELRITIDASNPAALVARALAGERPIVQVEGDAVLAADIGWLLDNLRWDVAADLERLFGPAVAHQVHQAGRALARGLRTALDRAAPWAERARAWGRFGAGRR